MNRIFRAPRTRLYLQKGLDFIHAHYIYAATFFSDMNSVGAFPSYATIEGHGDAQSCVAATHSPLQENLPESV